MIKSNINSRKSVKSLFQNYRSARILQQLVYVSILAVLFCACSSNDNGSDLNESDYYFKATLNGRKINFYNTNFQGGGNDNRFEHIIVAGFEDHYPTAAGTIPPSLDFEIWRTGGDIVAGTYSTPVEPEMVARYAIQTPDGTIVYSTNAADDVFTVKIESISKSGIRGTFSGKVRNLNSGTAIEITEGSFNLPYEDIINP